MIYELVCDNDGHWYVIPADKDSDWSNWLETEECALGDVPDYVEEVCGSPSLVKFKKYTIY